MNSNDTNLVQNIKKYIRYKKRQRLLRLVAKRHAIINKRVCITPYPNLHTLTTYYYITIDGTKIAEITSTDAPHRIATVLARFRRNYYLAHRHTILCNLR